MMGASAKVRSRPTGSKSPGHLQCWWVITAERSQVLLWLHAHARARPSCTEMPAPVLLYQYQRLWVSWLPSLTRNPS